MQSHKFCLFQNPTRFTLAFSLSLCILGKCLWRSVSLSACFCPTSFTHRYRGILPDMTLIFPPEPQVTLSCFWHYCFPTSLLSLYRMPPKRKVCGGTKMQKMCLCVCKDSLGSFPPDLCYSHLNLMLLCFIFFSF